MYFVSADQKMMAVSVIPGGTLFQAGPPAALFSMKTSAARSSTWHYDVTGDGERFLLLESVEEISKPMTLVINWLAATRR